MEIPGIADALNDPQMREKAEKQAEDLLADLKEKVGADIKDVGVLRKEMRVTVPESIISAHIRRNYDEIMQDVVVPGFRKGRAPRQLIERRFAGEVRESLKTTIVGQGFFAAVENRKLYEEKLAGTKVTLKVLPSTNYSDIFFKIDQVFEAVDPFLK